MVWPYEKALVTGGAGFIGSHLTGSLLEHCTVTVYDHFNTHSPNDVPGAADVIEADVRNGDRLTKAVAAADVVFHTAAQVSVTESLNAPLKSHAVNVAPLLTILEAARSSDTRVIFTSSSAVYGNAQYTPIDEDHPKEPISPYGLEKLTADHYCRLYHDRYSVDAIALRCFNVYGPPKHGGEYRGVLRIFRDQAAAGDPITIEGDGSQTRDFVHVTDVVDAALSAATSDAVGQAFNIGTGMPISIQELAELIQIHTNPSVDITHHDPRPGHIDRSVADTTKAYNHLNYAPEYEPRDGIEAYLTQTAP